MQAAVRPYVMAGVALAGASLIAISPIAPPPDLPRVSAAVRLASNDLLGGLTSIDPLASLSGLGNDLGSLANIGGLTSDLGSLANLGGLANDLGSLASLGGFGDPGSLLNIPYNVFADIVNIPYNEVQAIGIYAVALGPAGQVEFAMDPVTGALWQGAPTATIPSGDIPLGISGTGSWLMESLGNTWGWDDGNFGQLDGIANMLVPFPQFATPFAEELQLLAQAEIVDGAHVGCEFECASPLGYIGGWFHTPITELLNGYTYPPELQGNVTDPTGVDVIWSGQHVTLNPLLPFESLAANLTGSPTNNPIMFLNPAEAITNLVKLDSDLSYDFNSSVTGSFQYWGAPTDYGVPSLIGGTIQDLTGIPNQFPFPADQPLGAEPPWGPTAGPSPLLTVLPPGLGFQYLVNGLLGYLNPSTYLAAAGNDINGLLGLLSDPTAVLGNIPLLGLLGDPSALLGDFSSLLPGAGTNLAATLGPDIATNLSSLLPNAGADLAAMLGQEFAVNLGSLLPQLATAFIPF